MRISEQQFDMTPEEHAALDQRAKFRLPIRAGSRVVIVTKRGRVLRQSMIAIDATAYIVDDLEAP